MLSKHRLGHFLPRLIAVGSPEKVGSLVKKRRKLSFWIGLGMHYFEIIFL